MPIAMKRRAFIEILAAGHVKITNNNNTKEIKIKSWGSEFNHDRIDLVELKVMPYNKVGPFNCLYYSDKNGHFSIAVYNDQGEGIVGSVKLAPGHPKSANFVVTVIED